MKKLMFATALAAAMTGLADVTSANVVGYTEQPLVNGRYNFVAVPLGSVGKDVMWNLNDNVQGKNLKGTDDDSTTEGKQVSDQIQIWDPTQGSGGGYTDIYLYDSVEYAEYNGWWTYLGEKVGEDIYQSGFPTGAGMWMLKRDEGKDAAIVPAGEVPADKTIVKRLYKSRYNQVSDPYPVRLNLNDATQVEWTDSIGTDDDSTTEGKLVSDQIQVWDPTQGTGGGYTDIYMYKNDEYAEYNGWWTYLGEKIGEDIYTGGFDIGQQIWYLPRGEFSTEEANMCKITFFSPIK